MSVMDELTMTEVIFTEPKDGIDVDAIAFYLDAEQAILNQNVQAGQPEIEAMEPFLELLAVADQEYMEMPHYEEQVESAPEQVLDWDAVTAALEESQQILVMVQEMLSATLAEMGVEDHGSIRVYADECGRLHLVHNDHPRQFEIESVLNSPQNAQLREYYMSATAGMSLAGSLVGTLAVPPELAQQVSESQYAAAC